MTQQDISLLITITSTGGNETSGEEKNTVVAIRMIDFNKSFLADKKLQINALIKALRYYS